MTAEAATTADVVDDAVLADIVSEVFIGLFGEGRGASWLPGATPDAPLLVGEVDIAGGWNGTVSVACPEAMARGAAAELFALAESAVDDADLVDLVGEIANVAGGNVKSLLPDESALTLPRVTRADVLTAPPGTTAGLFWEGHALRAWLTPA